MIYKYASETKQWETITTTTRKFEYAEYNGVTLCYNHANDMKFGIKFHINKGMGMEGKEM